MRSALAVVLPLAAALLAGCERPPMEAHQQGFRGTGMVQIDNPRLQEAKVDANQVPQPLPPVEPGGPKASQVYKNVQVLGDLSAADFTRLMVAISAWVSPEQQCAYCHQGANFADDTLYTKVVARRMLQMTRHINSDWKNHVAQTGVTCYTCHRGRPVPANIWTMTPPSDHDALMVGWSDGQNIASRSVGLTSLPHDPFTRFLEGKDNIRVVAKTALPVGGTRNIKDTEWTYGLMIHMSEGLGVNCTFCHNSRSFTDWDQSAPTRATAWYGIRMVRDLNTAYLDPLKPVYPPTRLGLAGDPPKANCTTCHQGVNKPLYGVSMLKDYPALAGGPGGTAAAPDGNAIARVLFAVGQAVISPEAAKEIQAAAQFLAGRSGTTVTLSGYADKSGNATKNLELAKQRAFAVRDALKSAGVTESRIQLKKPEFVIGGAQADARRVDILAVQ
jgi:photosynthetic reaction center cytochrome c subunit